MIDPEFESNFLRLHQGGSDSWREYAKASHFKDQAGADSAKQRMVVYVQEWTAALKAEGLKFEAELKVDPAADDETKVAQLLVAFERGTRLERLWHDVVMQHRISGCCGKKVVIKAVHVLQAMNRIGDVAKFLDHPDLAVRARSASLLLDEMPDRCLPILREIHRTERALTAGWMAMFALSAYEDRIGKQV